MSKLIEIDGKFYKKCSVKLLPTDKETRLHKELDRVNELVYFSEKNEIVHKPTGMFIHITNDGDIQEKSYCLFQGYKGLANAANKNLSTELSYCETFNRADDKFYFFHPNKERRSVMSYEVKRFYSKIIASQYLSLKLPSISDGFIETFIESYNKGEIIEKVLVEYEKSLVPDLIVEGAEKVVETLKITKDGKITIKTI